MNENAMAAAKPLEGLRTADYDFKLPQELIAQDPLKDRSASRLPVRCSTGFFAISLPF